MSRFDDKWDTFWGRVGISIGILGLIAAALLLGGSGNVRFFGEWLAIIPFTAGLLPVLSVVTLVCIWGGRYVYGKLRR